MDYRIVRLIPLVVMFLSCSTQVKKEPIKESAFTTKENSEGIELLENGHPVFFYQRQPKPSTGNHRFNNYLHPLYDLKGDTITEEFPEDHPHHRGIFWAWHQLFIDELNLGDSWTMENISQEVIAADTKLLNGTAKLIVNVLWKSSRFENGKPFVEETTSIIVHRQESGIRKIDFEISLKALVVGVQFGGSEDEKGYGGFSARIKLPESLKFTSTTGPVIPLDGQVMAGAWMDFSASFNRSSHAKSGITILCHPSTPNFPAPWILRQTGSMQNIVFPGGKRIDLPMQKPIVLHYRLLVHNGDQRISNLTSMQAEYEKIFMNAK
jgi:Methane oxygenase PmoA